MPNDQQEGVASLPPKDDKKLKAEGEVPRSRVDDELKRFRQVRFYMPAFRHGSSIDHIFQLKDDFFRSATAAEKEPRVPRRRRDFTKLCRYFRSNGRCRDSSSCQRFHFVLWELPGKEFTDHPMDLYFANFQGFYHQRTKPFFDEFDRLCDHYGWSDHEATEPWYNFRIALVEEFNYVYGKDEENLRNWQKMFKIIGLPEPTSLSEAHTIMRPIRVNLVDMVESPRTGESIQRFETLGDLSAYSYGTGKIFPKEDAYNGGLLKMMLREISFVNQYRGTRLGGTEIGGGYSASW
ncbi:hypothetical protein IL306_000385 [Fusarium sp. DS 682]|nr:hypothetical protein IL306_000385 [Fusarium sp. DS 682]